ncbi:Caspase-1 [Merluccius polli]|uniref:Caspase-1 n=1 Tax=Merluccius polli TaxID=89951 RepID=A0AA47P4G9_MERPO|nr:Caspase-1 [Merluccius polli]
MIFSPLALPPLSWGDEYQSKLPSLDWNVTSELKRIRPDFVQNVSLAVLKGLLDDLLAQNVLNNEEKECVMEDHKTKMDRARCLIDSVIGKGEGASQKMIESMKDKDHELCVSLRLIPSQSPADMEAVENQGSSSKLIPSTDTFKTEKLKDTDNIYPIMDPAARTRLALLINNVTFSHQKKRNGAEKDEENMEKLLSELGYEVIKHRNRRGAEIDKDVENFSKDARLSKTDSVFVVIMSHGKMGAILGVDHSDAKPDVFPIKNISKHFECEDLRDKPKVIIIQSCRKDTDGDGPGSDPNQASDMQGGGTEDEDTEEDSAMAYKEKDFIWLLSCTADTVSYRHTVDGSFLIQYIVEIFNNHAHKDHIEELFRKANKGPNVQMAVKDGCTLTKHFYLFPGH